MSEDHPLAPYLKDYLDQKVFFLFKTIAGANFNEASDIAVSLLKNDPKLDLGRALAKALGKIKK